MQRLNKLNLGTRFFAVVMNRLMPWLKRTFNPYASKCTSFSSLVYPIVSLNAATFAGMQQWGENWDIVWHSLVTTKEPIKSSWTSRSMGFSTHVPNPHLFSHHWDCDCCHTRWVPWAPPKCHQLQRSMVERHRFATFDPNCTV